MDPTVQITDRGSVITLRVEAARALDDARHHAADLIAEAEREADAIRIQVSLLAEEARAELVAAQAVRAEADAAALESLEESVSLLTDSEAQARTTIAEAQLKARLIMGSARSQARLMISDAAESVAGIADETEGGEDAVDTAQVGDEFGHHPGV
jgi:hypothetical protein